MVPHLRKEWPTIYKAEWILQERKIIEAPNHIVLYVQKYEVEFMAQDKGTRACENMRLVKVVQMVLHYTNNLKNKI